jgi:alpha-galactosidase
LDSISPAVLGQVAEAIRVYKEVLREHIPASVPFYPLGKSDVTDRNAPLTLGMRSPGKTFMAVWRVDGPAITDMPWAGDAELLYPMNLGIKVRTIDGHLRVEFPRPHMACLISMQKVTAKLQIDWEFLPVTED